MGFWVHSAAAKHPDRVAIEGPERSVTYAQLARLAVVGTRELQHLDVRAGERVALDISDRFELAVALHACLLGGVAAVPIDPRLSADERAARTAGAVVELRRAPGGSHPGLLPRAIRAEPGVKLITGLHPQAWSPALMDATATVMYTSGTTAAPKSVELTHGNWYANAAGSARALGHDGGERWLCALPLAHVAGLAILIRSLVHATTVVLHDGFETETVLADLMDPTRRITMVSLVPTMLARLLDAGLSRPPLLRWAVLGGAPIPPRLLEHAVAAGVPVVPTYGMTETCSLITAFGLPLHNVEVRTSGSEGEIVVRGPMVARNAADDHGWLHTGDLGRLDDGRLVVVGRKSETIVSGGENISPAEVEEVLQLHPDVADAAVFGRPDREWGEAVIARVVVREGAAVDPDGLSAFCRERLAAFKVPKAIEFASELPRAESGKLRRRELD
jgi:O-succinylbenzoic acid--CoA ligase